MVQLAPRPAALSSPDSFSPALPAQRPEPSASARRRRLAVAPAGERHTSAAQSHAPRHPIHTDVPIRSRTPDRSTPRNLIGRPINLSAPVALGVAVCVFALGAAITARLKPSSGSGAGSDRVVVRDLPRADMAASDATAKVRTSAESFPVGSTAGSSGSSADGLVRAVANTAVPSTNGVGAPSVGGAAAAHGMLVVHAAGAVLHPGVYLLPAGARAADAVQSAGGMTSDADPDRVNLATPLVDGNRLYIPHRGVPAPAVPNDQVTGAVPAASDPQKAMLDLNTATPDQLDALPGVGPATAAAIVEYRTRVGRFRSVTQLLDVPGIGEAKLAAIRKQLTVG